MTPLEMFLLGVIVTILTTAYGIMARKIVSLLKYKDRLEVFIATNCSDKGDTAEIMAAKIEDLKALLLSKREG